MKLHPFLSWILLAPTFAACTPNAPTSLAGDSAHSIQTTTSIGSESAAPCTPGRPLTFVSYNVNYGLARADGTVDPATERQIKALIERADLIAFQETTDEWERAIVALSKDSHPHRRFHPPGRFVAGGIGVVSRLPITAEDILPSPVDWFPAQRLEVTTDNGPLQLLNVHLRPMISEGGSWVSGYFTTGHFRETEANAHLAKLRPDLPTIVLGDFNEEDPGVALTIFESLGLRNAVSIRSPSDTTWRWTAYGVPLALRLDHVLYPPSVFDLESATVHQGGNSDHLPVEVKLVRSCTPGGTGSQSSVF